MNQSHLTHSGRPIRTALVATLLVLTLVAFGCRGEQGPAGTDGGSFDTTPPTIVLLSPEFGDTLVDTLVAQAYAVDNVDVDDVTFYLDGNSQINDSTWSIDFTSPYEWTFDLGGLGLAPGLHSIMARATDVEQNWADSPTVLFYLNHLPPAGAGVLSLGSVSNLASRTLPLRDSEDSTLVLDSLLFARFTADRLLRIDSVRVWVDTLQNEAVHYDRPLNIEIFNSNGVYPTESIASAQIDSLALNSGGAGWRSVNFHDDLIQFDQGERFHVTVSIDAPTDTTLMVLGTMNVPAYPYATANLSGFYLVSADSPRFVTFQEYTPNALEVPELVVEVYVERLP